MLGDLKEQYFGSPEYMKLQLEQRLTITRLLFEMEQLRREAAMIAWCQETQ